MVRRLAAVLLLALATASPALAGDIHVGLGILSGSLSASAAPASLGGTVQVAVKVVDARGNGKGWDLRVAGAGSPTVTAITVRCANGSTCTMPDAHVTLPRTLGSAATQVFGADARTGLGAFVVTLTVSGGHGPLSVGVVSR